MHFCVDSLVRSSIIQLLDVGVLSWVGKLASSLFNQVLAAQPAVFARDLHVVAHCLCFACDLPVVIV